MKTLVISPSASSALEVFSNRSNVCDEKRQYGEMEYWDEEAKSYSVLLAQIIEIAKEDLS